MLSGLVHFVCSRLEWEIYNIYTRAWDRQKEGEREKAKD